MWIRAVWREGDREEEGVIPSVWVSEKFVFWPPGTNAEKAVKNKEVPSSSWKRFDLIKIKHQAGKIYCLENIVFMFFIRFELQLLLHCVWFILETN